MFESASTHNQNHALLVFIPGFMGCPKDWAQVVAALPRALQKKCLTLALPHVPDQANNIHDYAKTLSFALIKNLQFRQLSVQGSSTQSIVLVGYSMGARLAMAMAASDDLATHGVAVEALILVGGHPGLDSADARTKRHQWTQKWLEYMTTKPLNEWLNTWYQQSIFEGLTDNQIAQQVSEKEALICHKTLKNIQRIMSVSCLSSQPNYHDFLTEKDPNVALNTLYVSGEWDGKYGVMGAQLSQDSPYVEHKIIKQCSHSVHRQAPKALAKSIQHFMQTVRKIHEESV